MNKDLNLFREQLLLHLKDEVASAEALSQSLESERMALSSLDDKLITINSANKQRLIIGLQNASNKRLALMEQNNFEVTPKAIKSFIQSQESNLKLNSLFTHLEEIAQHCFEQNRLIGQLINRRTQFISQALNSLSPSTNLQSHTYSENGSKTKQDGIRNLGTI